MDSSLNFGPSLMTLAEAVALFRRLEAPSTPSTPAALPTTQRRAGPRPARSKYFPHQSVRECARRMRQTQRANKLAFARQVVGQRAPELADWP